MTEARFNYLIKQIVTVENKKVTDLITKEFKNLREEVSKTQKDNNKGINDRLRQIENKLKTIKTNTRKY